MRIDVEQHPRALPDRAAQMRDGRAHGDHQIERAEIGRGVVEGFELGRVVGDIESCRAGCRYFGCGAGLQRIESDVVELAERVDIAFQTDAALRIALVSVAARPHESDLQPLFAGEAMTPRVDGLRIGLQIRNSRRDRFFARIEQQRQRQ